MRVGIFVALHWPIRLIPVEMLQMSDISTGKHAALKKGKHVYTINATKCVGFASIIMQQLKPWAEW